MKKKDFIALCKNTKVLLLGDIMLDQYVLGKVNRISPEAPVPVFLAEEKKQVLGGAGNVFNNLTTLGVSTTFLTAIGSDSNGKKIRRERCYCIYRNLWRKQRSSCCICRAFYRRK